MTGENASSAWDAALDDGLGLHGGLDFGALLGFDSPGDEDGATSVDADEVVADLLLGDGVGLVDAGVEAAGEILDVGDDFDEG